MNNEIELDPDVFHGELTTNRAQIFVRVPREAEFQDCMLYGKVIGPRCELAHTLPAKFALTDLGAGPTLLARTTITDPCYWTGDLPQLYDVQVELRRGTEVIAREQRMIGLRGIGGRSSPTGNQLIREGKVWVPRGVELSSLDSSELLSLREQLLVGICQAPPLDLLVEATRRGVYLIVLVDAAQQEIVAALRQLARWPAVMMAVVRGADSHDRGLAQVAPNLLLAQPVPAADLGSFQPAAWASVMIAEVAGDSVPVAGITNCPLPVIIQRPTQQKLSAEAARAECDRLQRDLAASGQFAGYLV
ncbi:hypothetical protein ETAA8_60120 [Anatilimnocola aggregata]|uniref:Glycoside hydrolase family 2 immunoglobulin-like beta-sandwich domain-containing protein n=1 Tax=Anatilimnocola aggregata TaxID=2528021 RepID=A0A517YKX8_9BACT|nr:hypothetical protein [Anatilimnocola aggregata]QDU30863.1 hypothetical protein ETAA8_60120 [Anatilimnocola aggregata]